jgi:aminoglycoside 6-adenylyltransferase
VNLPGQTDVIARLVAWAEGNDSIRALVLTSSRARDDGTSDLLSDYDVVVATRDHEAFAHDDVWTSAYGRPLVHWGDEHVTEGSTTYFRGVVYEDGTRIDYTFWPEHLLDRIAESAVLPEDLDVGYRVLVDKDGRTSSWHAPTHRAHVPAKPTQEQYEALVHEFWWDTTYVAKSLWRGEVFFAKFMLDYDTKFVVLRRFLEWKLELAHDWSLRPGSHGRGLEQRLPRETWDALAATYVGTGIEDNWNALLRTTTLFREVAIEVGQALGYTYPQHVDDAVTAHLAAVRNLPQRHGSRQH